MLPTFVIGLREGLEAALIVGIIAAFLRAQGRRDLVRWVLAGVGVAAALCLAAGVTLDAVSRSLPQRQQEGLETVIGGLAVVMVTYMVVWMRRHARQLRGSLEALAADALGRSAGRHTARAALALVLMAFLAVLREGVETAVFLVAAFNESGSGASGPAGAVLGIVVAIAIGYAIYRGGLRINLSRFFRVTGAVLVLVAGGLVVNALHTAHEAGWLSAGQASTVNLSWLARPGSVQSSLLTGMLGVQPHPVLIEVVAWLAYIVPVGLYVVWPPGRGITSRSVARAVAAAASAGAVATVVVVAVVSGTPTTAADADACAGASRGCADPSAAPAHAASVTLTAAAGCVPDRTTFAAGGITFRVVNRDATAVTEVEVLAGDRIIGEKENLPPGFSGEFAITAGPGPYTLYCPGAATERIALTVVGTGSTAAADGVSALLAAGTKAYAAYVETQAAGLVTAVAALARSLYGTDLAAAQQAYVVARPFYEKIEPVAESFTTGTGDNLDADIDARAGDVPDAQWRGFHRIEKGLFADRSLRGLAPVGDRLLSDVTRLHALTAKLSYQPTELANGAQELLDEVAASKITGEEERYSRIDVLDIDSNIEGAAQAFAQVRPGLAEVDPQLAETISARLQSLARLVDRYRDTGDRSGFVRYPALTVADKRQLAAAVKAVQEPLSRVASKVAG